MSSSGRRVPVLTTGGTISMRLQDGTPFDQADLTTGLDGSQVVLDFRSVLDKGSKDIVPADWEVVGAAVSDALAEDPAGLVVTHGTDTLAYTAAALSFLLPNPGVPVVLTGSMIPGGDAGSDSVANLRDAVEVAAHGDLGEVCVVFAGNVLRGNRARKVHSHELDAFASVNRAPLGTIGAGPMTLAGRPRAPRADPRLLPGFESRVAFVTLTPATTPEVLDRALDGMAGSVLAGTGIGHVHEDLHPVIERFDRPVLLTTQVPVGGERLGLYPSDRRTLALRNVVPAGPMTPETALVKLMWALGQPGDPWALLRADLAGELEEDLG